MTETAQRVWWMWTFRRTSVLWSTAEFIDGNIGHERSTLIPADLWTEYEETGDESMIDRYLMGQAMAVWNEWE